MTNEEALFNAASLGNLAKVTALLEDKNNPNLDINALHPHHQTRAIDVAAQNYHWEVFEYLLSKGASLSVPTQPSFLYWLIRHLNKDNKAQIFKWIETNQNKLLDATLTPDHLNAILGKKTNWESKAVHWGLYPIHYGALANNPNCESMLPAILNTPLSASPEGLTLAWLLADCNRWDLLNTLVTKNSNALSNLNAAPQAESDPNKGINLAWLSVVGNQWNLLEKLAEKKPNVVINLNAAPQTESHPNKGMTVAWLLAFHKRWDLLNTFAEKNPDVLVNLNAAPKAEGYRRKDISLAWLLADSSQWGLFNALAEKNPNDVIDLNAGPKAESHRNQGITLAWLLAARKQWDLLNTLTEKNPNAWVDLNAAPQTESHTSRGITLAWLLADSKQWDLLKKLAAKKPNVVIDLNAAPQAEGHPAQKITLGRALANGKQWDLLKTLISQNYVKVNDPDTYLTSLKELSSDPTFKELLIQIELEYQEIMISKLIIHLINDKNSEEQETFNLLEKAIRCSESCINQLDKTSSYYQKAQTIKAHILLSLNTPQLPDSCKEKLLDLFPKISSPFSAVNDPTHQLVLLQTKAVIEAHDTQLGIEIMAEQLKELEVRSQPSVRKNPINPIESVPEELKKRLQLENENQKNWHTIQEKEAEIAQLKKDIGSKTEELFNKDETIQFQGQKITALNQTIKELEYMKQMQNISISSLQDDSMAISTQNKSKIVQLTTENNKLRQEKASLEAQARTLEQSYVVRATQLMDNLRQQIMSHRWELVGGEKVSDDKWVSHTANKILEQIDEFKSKPQPTPKDAVSSLTQILNYSQNSVNTSGWYQFWHRQHSSSRLQYQSYVDSIQSFFTSNSRVISDIQEGEHHSNQSLQ